MCIAVPGKITGIHNTRASVNSMDVETRVNIQLIDKPKVGDYVLIHAGCAIETIDENYFNELTNIYESFLNNSFINGDEKHSG